MVIFFSVLLLVLLWVMEILNQGLSFSIVSLARIHRLPALWAFDLFIASIPFVYRKSCLKYSGIINRIESQLQNLTDRINRYSDFIKKLIVKDFESSPPVQGVDDSLGKNLVKLRDSLRIMEKNAEQDAWINQGKDSISSILSDYNDRTELAGHVLQKVCSYISVERGSFYIFNQEKDLLICTVTHPPGNKELFKKKYSPGKGIIGECAYEMDFVYKTEIPEDYPPLRVSETETRKPGSVLAVPLEIENSLLGVMEFSTLKPEIPKVVIQLMLELATLIARSFHNLNVKEETVRLLDESREVTQKLEEREEELEGKTEEMKKVQLDLEEANRQLQLKVKEAENAGSKLHWLLENASELITIYDRNLELSYVSPSVKKITGYSEEEYKTGKDFDRLGPEDAEEFKKLINNSFDYPDRIQSIQYPYIKKEGETIFLESIARNLLDDPAIEGIIINSRDITEMIRAEKEERLKSRMQSLSENSPDLILRLSSSGVFHYVNPMVEKFTGIPARDLVNRNVSELRGSSDLRDYLEKSLTGLRAEPVKKVEEVHIPLKQEGKITERIINFETIPELIRDELETVLFVGHDVTEAKNIERELTRKNTNLQDSINYSRRIQRSIIPGHEIIKRSLPDSFMFFRPREVISGDFPWLLEIGDNLFIAVVDCSGHGIPGSMLSFIAYFLLNDVVEKSHNMNCGEICNLLHLEYRKTLKQDTDKVMANDGLDLALCKISKSENKLDFAGAHRPLYLLRGRELTEYKGNRKAIGGHELFKKADENFVNYSIDIEPGDKIFMFSDGLTDQLGGPYGRKFSAARVRELILQNHAYKMKQYDELFRSDFSEWMKDFRQLDDVLMIGIEF